jgi:hypothetical protein
MDVGKSFSYQFEDEKWLSKLFIAALVSAVPILNFAFVGYMVDVLRNVEQRALRPLPEWTEFGEKFVKGFWLFLAGLIYSIPALVLGCIPMSAFFLPALSESSNVQEGLLAAASGVGLVFGCLLVIYGLLLTFYFPAVYINFSRKGTLASCFEFSAIFKTVSANLNKYLTAWLISLVAGIVVGLVIGLVSTVLQFIPCQGQILGWILGAIGGVYIMTIYAFLFGQVAQDVPVTV